MLTVAAGKPPEPQSRDHSYKHALHGMSTYVSSLAHVCIHIFSEITVTTITALIGSAPALLSDPQPGKPGYGPGMEAIPASAVIDYPI